ncbi:MAG: iron-sulfur cluster assembly protein, partial [Pseudomonadota bacterium]
MPAFLDFEKPIAELEGKIEELRHLSDGGGLNITEEVTRLQEKVERMLRQTYSKLTPWQKVQVARHADRPHFVDYTEALVKEFVPLAGDRAFADDDAILGGIGRFRGRSIVLIGNEKGHDTDSRIAHNFGMGRPEGYRKAQRLMRLAERFRNTMAQNGRIEVEPQQGRAHIKMTLTAPGCPVAQTFPGTVECAVRELPEVSEVCVELVWDPPWDKSRMTESARLTL